MSIYEIHASGNWREALHIDQAFQDTGNISFDISTPKEQAIIQL